jgi:hypothetical protein
MLVCLPGVRIQHTKILNINAYKYVFHFRALIWKHYSGPNFVKYETTKIMSPDFDEVASSFRIRSIREVSCIFESQITAYVRDNINARL